MSPTAISYLASQIEASGLSKREWYRQVYLKSEHWKKLRQAKLDFSGRNCEQCQTTSDLDVHHIEYRSIYDVTIFDLQVLCRACHNAEHPNPKDQPPKPAPASIDTLADLKAFYKAAKASAPGHWTNKVQIAYEQTVAALRHRGNVKASESRWLDCVLAGLQSDPSAPSNVKAAKKRAKRKRTRRTRKT